MKTTHVIQEIRSFNRFYTNLLGVLDRHFQQSPYSLTEVRILFEVFHNPDSTARQIKYALQLDEGYLSRTIGRLIKHGLIIRKPSTNDGREFNLSLSPKGVKIFLGLDEQSERSIESMITHLSPDESAELVTIMHRIQELLIND
jgi:DNA-binding MarR family transcriptional regulator